MPTEWSACPPPVVRAVAVPERDSALLWFKGDPAGHEFCVRGAVAWPMPRPEPGQPLIVVGYALLCIQDVESKTIWVMDEREFLTIDHLFNPNRTIRVEGLMPWLDSMRLRYGLRTVLWHQDETIHDRWMAAIEESKLREAPRPEFLQVPWGEDAQGEMTVREWLGRRQLLLDEESRTYRALVAQTPGGPYPPEFWALMVAVAGYAVYPWQKPEDELAMRRGPFPRNPLFQLVARHARNS